MGDAGDAPVAVSALVHETCFMVPGDLSRSRRSPGEGGFEYRGGGFPDRPRH
jgi:hypothetical protein